MKEAMDWRESIYNEMIHDDESEHSVSFDESIKNVAAVEIIGGLFIEKLKSHHPQLQIIHFRR